MRDGGSPYFVRGMFIKGLGFGLTTGVLCLGSPMRPDITHRKVSRSKGDRIEVMDNIFCTQENCTNESRSMGMCATHYSQGLLNRQGLSRNDAPYANCAVSHCDLEANSRKEGALCNPHYQRKYRGLDVEAYVIPPNHPARNAPPCAEPGCERRSVTKGFCNYHRLRAQQGKSSVPSTVKVNPPCAFEGCEYLSSQTGLCQGHYEQKRLSQELKPLRGWGKYVTGELRCPIPTCRRPQMTQEVCLHHARMSREYKLTTEQMIEVWKNPVCSNPRCGNTTRLHMDHDHATGEFRALLCSGCNTALGHLKEDPERMTGLREYIERFR